MRKAASCTSQSLISHSDYQSSLVKIGHSPCIIRCFAPVAPAFYTVASTAQDRPVRHNSLYDAVGGRQSLARRHQFMFAFLLTDSCLTNDYPLTLTDLPDSVAYVSWRSPYPSALSTDTIESSCARCAISLCGPEQRKCRAWTTQARKPPKDRRRRSFLVTLSVIQELRLFFSSSAHVWLVLASWKRPTRRHHRT